MLRGEADLMQPGGRLMCLSLGLLFLHRQGAVDATLEVRACMLAYTAVASCRAAVRVRAPACVAARASSSPLQAARRQHLTN